ncbi:antibiotic biosynthesis monooxygenase [Nocardioides seonyuensis]|uniref:Antibiotic biosynthesis monooxygenase n=1 Tax=Nocardioides seonyuensis TaxID=2518371 RepID=A0A4P7IIU8_9ACTN|nr:antibiotic biosynthesis monooxygenase family protein [Nocardioides seonyuensis]QBX56630.1 antibiotic biosynthesis monooxygenase [Nocardioides seonyuensis]
MLVVTRFRVPSTDADAFRERIELARATLAAQRGHLDSTLGRNVDDPELWVLTTRWENVGSYRRALSSYDAKLHAWPALTLALDEPSAYEVVEPGVDLNDAGARSIG